LERRPNPLEMLNDPVYQAYTSPYLRAERERAEQELKEERERAEQSIEQVEQIKAFLDSQGIVLPEELQKSTFKGIKDS